MSSKKLQKFLNKPVGRIKPTDRNIKTPVILTDSKGIALQNLTKSTNPVEKKIKWWCKRGATVQDRYDWLKKNLETEIALIGNIHLYVWLGTCNLTTKNKSKKENYITLTKEDNSAVDKTIKYLKKITELIKSYPNSTVTILEIPQYSILAYNKKAGYVGNKEKFNRQEKQLHTQVYKLNGQIRQLNEKLQNVPRIHFRFKY